MVTTMATNLMEASRQWATRPDDQRFTSLADLRASVAGRKQESWTGQPSTKDLQVRPVANNGLAVEVFNPGTRQQIELTPTNWAFSQLAGYAGAPAAYMRKLPNQLAAINLQWGLENMGKSDDALVLARSNGTHELRAMTSTSYGRIWDIDVVNAVERVNESGRWEIPAASYTTQNPKRATTLYASDRDVFIFLVDPKNPIEVNGEILFRGFYVWNSEVGSQVFGLTTFLYRYVCDNRIIWGATEVKELRIRHTGGAPERFAYEGARQLAKYAEESTSEVVAQIKAAKEKDIPKAKDESVSDWLAKKGFTRKESDEAVKRADEEEGESRSLWNIINGVTAYARQIANTDDRVNLEKKAGKLMDLVA